MDTMRLIRKITSWLVLLNIAPALLLLLVPLANITLLESYLIGLLIDVIAIVILVAIPMIVRLFYWCLHNILD